MSFTRFSQIFKWKSKHQVDKVKVLLKNQMLVYFWSSRIRQSFKIYNFYMRKWHERNFVNIIKQFRSSPVSLVMKIIVNSKEE